MGRHFKKADSADQGYLLPPDTRAWLPARHLAWALLALAGELDMSGFEARYRADGQGPAAYHPAMMVTLVMYCYCKGIRSSRGIEMATFDDVGARVICGNQHPDHATVARFAGRHERELTGLLASSVAACAREGLVSVDVVAGDGTKVKASASMAANATAAGLEAEIAALEEVIAAEVALWVAEHLAADAAEAVAGGAGPQDAGPAGAGPGGQAGRTGRKRTAHTLARRRQAQERLDAEAAARAGKERDKQQGKAARLAERAARKEAEADRLFAVAAAKAEAYAARAAACAPGKKPTGAAPGAPQDNRDVRRVRAVTARLRERAARAAAAGPAGPGKELKASLTDPGSRVMPLKKGGFDQLYNAQVIACKKQVILAIGTHDNPAGTSALHPLPGKACAVVAAAGITGRIGKALWDAGYASDANFTAATETGLYVAITRESRQAGRGTGGYAPAAMMQSWEQMAARAGHPRGQGPVQAARRHHRARLRPAVQPARPAPELPRRQDRPRTAPVGHQPQPAQGHQRPPAHCRARNRLTPPAAGNPHLPPAATRDYPQACRGHGAPGPAQSAQTADPGASSKPRERQEHPGHPHTPGPASPLLAHHPRSPSCATASTAPPTLHDQGKLKRRRRPGRKT
jgi:transposase